MSDTPATAAALRAMLLAGAGDPPLARASDLRGLAGRLGSAAAAALADLAADAALPPGARVVALLAVALALADDPAAAAPEAALDAIDDPDVVGAAIDGGLTAALTGVLRAAPVDGALRATRRLVGRRCLAAGEQGPHIARLLLDAGDQEGAARAVATYLAGRLDPGSPPPLETRALLQLVPAWTADPAFAAALDRALAEIDPEAPAHLASLLRNYRDH